MFIDENKLKDFIVDSGLITRDSWESAHKKISKDGRQTVGNFLVSEGLISEDELKRIQAYILGIPFIDVGSQRIPFDILSLIPEPIARKNNIIAYAKDGHKLEVAMLDTDNLQAIEFITKKTGLKILPRLTSTDALKKAILQYQKSLKDEFGDIIKKETSIIDQNGQTNNGDLQKIATDLPVIKVVDTLLKHSIIQGASDIHIEPNEANLIVRYRVDGLLHDAMVLPKHSGPAIIARIKVLSNLKIDEKRLPQDGRFKIELESENVSFRVSIMPVSNGEKIVMRVLREGAGGFNLEALGFHGEGLEKVHSAIKQSNGMILTTGPTGSGKTVTLYTLIDLMNSPNINISTIEDPIEYQMTRVNQTQVNPEIGFNFTSGLRTLMRQDPDVIMVGEIRDGETANLAISASLTGHLVLSTLHTNSASGTILRLNDIGAQTFLLASTLKLIIAQRLVRKLGTNKEKYFLKKVGIDQLRKIANLDLIHRVLVEEKIIKSNLPWTEIPFYRSASKNDQDAYSGRVGIQEILKVTESIKDLILKNESEEKIEKQARSEGMMTMVEDGIYKSVIGLTTLEEVLRSGSE